jgi:fructose-1,6-bisphosphatase II
VLCGIQLKGGFTESHTLVMRAKSGTVRFIEGHHSMKKKPNLAMKDSE